MNFVSIVHQSRDVGLDYYQYQLKRSNKFVFSWRVRTKMDLFTSSQINRKRRAHLRESRAKKRRKKNLKIIKKKNKFRQGGDKG
jgi:hypothetical protein